MDSRGFKNLESGLKIVGFNEKEVNGILGNNWYNFYKGIKLMKINLRNPNTVMKLSKLGSFHQSKLSFLRSFLKEFKDWEYKKDSIRSE